MSNQLVLVTGVSGFLGAHIVNTLLTQGYRVRGTVRSAKVAAHKEVYAKHGDRVEIVAIDDLVNGDYTPALQGVSAVIHVASPMTGRSDATSTIDIAVGGTMNLLRQAENVGIKHASFTSSLAAVIDLKNFKATLTEQDWNPATKEEAIANSDNDVFVYMASKTLAEREIWKFGEDHPDLHITTINPNFFIGPFAPEFILETGSINALSTNTMIYKLLLPETTNTTPPFGYVDVRDVAKALVGGIGAEGKNRILLTGEWFEHTDAVEYIAGARPELRDRLPTKIIATGQTQSMFNNT